MIGPDDRPPRSTPVISKTGNRRAEDRVDSETKGIPALVDAPPAPQPSAKGAAPDAPPSAQDDHLALLRRIQYLLGGLLVLFVLWSISLAKVVILPIVLGVLIALTLSPLVVLVFVLGLYPDLVLSYLHAPIAELLTLGVTP